MVPEYSRNLVSLSVPEDPNAPITATVNCLEIEGKVQTIKARYVVGCDGARSTVRQALGYDLKGSSARQLWGVMDVLAVTDFPDIRLKAAIQSADHGSLLIIPREGGYLVRLYIELDALGENERASDRDVSPEVLVSKAHEILAPYTLTVKEVAWWSAYEIGQRVCDAFDDVPAALRESRTPRIFIAGDACHTHSPKAGQGMNVSMADAFNLGWKLSAVAQGQALPRLLSTYSAERQAKAQELIDFDRDMARMFSAKPKTAAEAEQFQTYFKRHGRYTAGVETQYAANLIVAQTPAQSRAAGYPVGMRFHSAPVTRVSDGKPMQLGHVLKADGRWRIMVFAGAADDGRPDGRVATLCSYLNTAPTSPVRRYTAKHSDIDSVLDVRSVFQASHQSIDIGQLPEILTPRKGQFGLIDYENCFAPDLKNGPDIFDHRGIDRHRGAVIVIRPALYESSFLELEDTDVLERFFDPILIPV